ncbi:uncharacterized protein LOC141647426 isoform X2 [Silene latifolia]|uniref:uncharacterized protein LOC141647426 isoform X2 n=1 Tax=Silene latifolia TaxID=37657 RepID=UPI003D77BCEE
MDKEKEKKMRGSQIPGFGNWDYDNELPITQYFESARQAGLSRYTSSEQCNKPHTVLPSKQGKVRKKRSDATQTHTKEGSRKQAGKVFDMTATELPNAHAPPAVYTNNKKQQQFEYEAGLCRAPKAVDEDLYKISPHLLHKKRSAGFFSRCLMSPCGVSQ